MARKIPTNVQRVEAALKTLGKLSVEQIKSLFIKLGIKGRRICCTSCPVFRYLQHRGCRRVRVGGMWTLIKGDDGAAIDNPRSVRRFISEVDAGNIPEVCTA